MEQQKFAIENAIEELKEARYIGEDGDMAVIAPGRARALQLFRKEVRSDVGEFEALEMKLEDVGVGYIGLFTDEEIIERSGCETHEDCEKWREEESFWYVSWAAGAKGPKVWVYHCQ